MFLQRGSWTSVNLKSGGNTNITNFSIHTSPNLYCIQVDDVAYANTNFTSKDAQAIFSESCSQTNIPDDNFEAFLEANGMGNGIANDNQVFTDNISSVTSLDVGDQNISDLTGIEDFTALESLDADNNNLSSVDLNSNILLTYINLQGTSLTTIDVSTLPSLEVLLVSGITTLTSIDVTNNVALKTLRVTSNLITSLDVSNNTALESLTIRYTGITSLDLSANTALTYLDVQDVLILALDLSNNTALTQLFAKQGAFTSLNVKNGNNTNMTTFSVHTQSESYLYFGR